MQENVVEFISFPLTMSYLAKDLTFLRIDFFTSFYNPVQCLTFSNLR